MKKILVVISLLVAVTILFLLYKAYKGYEENKYIENLKENIDIYLNEEDYVSAYKLYESLESEYQVFLDVILNKHFEELCSEAYDSLNTVKLKKAKSAGFDYEIIQTSMIDIDGMIQSFRDSDKNYNDALVEYNERNFEKAKEHFKLVIEEDTNYENAQVYIAEIENREQSWKNNLFGRSKYENEAACDGEFIYVPFAIDETYGIYKINSQGKAEEFLPICSSDTELIISGINIVGDYIYFIAGKNIGSGYSFLNPYNVYEMKKDGTDLCMVLCGNFTDMFIKGERVYLLSREKGLVEYDSYFKEINVINSGNAVAFSFVEDGFYYTVQQSMLYNNKSIVYYYNGEESVEIDEKEYLHYYSYGEYYVEQWQGGSLSERLILNDNNKEVLISNSDIYKFYGKIEDAYLFSIAGHLGKEIFCIYNSNIKETQEISIHNELDECRILYICSEYDAIIVEKGAAIYWTDFLFENYIKIEEVPIEETLFVDNNDSFNMTVNDDFYADEKAIGYIEDKLTWVYIDNELNIALEKRYIDEYDCNVYITHVFTENFDLFSTGNGDVDSVFSLKSYKASYISDEYNAIYSQSSDGYYYGGNSKQGIIIRNSTLIRDYLGKSMIAFFEDGSIKAYTEEDDVTGQYLLEQGATEAFSFGPILIENGEVNYSSMYSGLSDRNPRSAIGYVAPGHYVMVACDGRDFTVSRGLNMVQLARIFENEGCKLAYNLDGGLTTTVLFMGNYITQRPPKEPGSEQHLHRYVSEIIYIGTDESSPIDMDSITYDYVEYKETFK
ncbi:MAG: phosphodiester glycosidase family protein [Clostridia bacterium]|nr:phosphodiester glycosidase family protein [Clostridia bacterium]